MRLLVMFDLPSETPDDLRKYRRLIKILEGEGFYRYQYSVFVVSVLALAMFAQFELVCRVL